MTDARGDQLEALWLQASHDVHAESVFLRELSGRRVLVILRQPPGPGRAAPERNLVQWKRESDGAVFVPIFTDEAHLSMALPSPAKLVRVSVPVLLAAGGDQRYIINPLAKAPFELNAARLVIVRRYVAETHHDSVWPSRAEPWGFRLPDDALFPVAVELVEWFNQNGRVNEAFLYELIRGEEPRAEVVLGLDVSADQALADTLIEIATNAGADVASFIVRFLPEEASHREGIALAGITPFYQRPTSSHY